MIGYGTSGAPVDARVTELDRLNTMLLANIEHARTINERLERLAVRILGPSPNGPGSPDKPAPAPPGALGVAFSHVEVLAVVLQDITNAVSKLEQL